MNKYIICLFALISVLLLTVTVESRLIPFLKRKAKQPIYEGGPGWHMSKSGTPTMGGVAFIISFSLTLFICALILIFSNSKSEGLIILITLIFALGNAAIGILDDLTKLYKKKNSGLSPLQKILLQSVLAILYLVSGKGLFADGSSIFLGFGEIDLGVFYYPLLFILLLGVVNCANLTDGVDGLASSVAATIGICFAIIGYAAFTAAPIISSALVGGACGFLIFNSHPAKVFMGDTGSLFLGALTVGIAFSLGNPFLILPVGIVYVIEGTSVILQVLFFKLTKKRLFKMAPIHHHLEKCGYSENRICLLAVIITLVFSALSFILLRR